MEVVDARQLWLADGGLILPEDICIFLQGLDADECHTDEIENRWTFPFSVDYKFLDIQVCRAHTVRMFLLVNFEVKNHSKSTK